MNDKWNYTLQNWIYVKSDTMDNGKKYYTYKCPKCGKLITTLNRLEDKNFCYYAFDYCPKCNSLNKKL